MARAAKIDVGEAVRLDAQAWIAAALELLAGRGIDGVRVEPLAKELNVTKGSFYWHFKDRDALFEAMLADWRKRATLQIIERIERTHETPEVRMKQLLRLPYASPRSKQGAEIELSIRLWGRRDPRARAALEEVDQLRLRYIGQLLQQCGFSSGESHARAVVAYSYMRVAASLNPAGDVELLQQCETLIASPELSKG